MSAESDIPISAELVRKGIHLFALVIPIGYFFLTFQIAIISVLVASGISILLDLSRFKGWPLWRLTARLLKPIIREHEFKGGFTGSTYILATSSLSIFLFPKMVAISAIVFIIIGDTAAALIGRIYGKHRLVKGKSIEGSTACLISLMIATFFIPGLPIWVGFAGAFAATAAEAFSGKLDDNFTVQVASGLVMLGMLRLIGVDGSTFFAAWL